MAQFVPTWLPASKVSRSNLTPVAWFVYSFDALVAKYAATDTPAAWSRSQFQVIIRRPGLAGAGPFR